MSKKGIVGLPVVALVSMLLFTIILLFWAVYFFVFGFGDQVKIGIEDSEMIDQTRLINLIRLPVEVDGAKLIFADLIVFVAEDKDKYYSLLGEKLGPILERIPHPTKSGDSSYSGWLIRVSELEEGKWKEKFKVQTTVLLAGTEEIDFESIWHSNKEFLKQNLILSKNANSNIKVELYLKCKCEMEDLSNYVI